jgi:hypothetical protein
MENFFSSKKDWEIEILRDWELYSTATVVTGDAREL